MYMRHCLVLVNIVPNVCFCIPYNLRQIIYILYGFVMHLSSHPFLSQFATIHDLKSVMSVA